ncbi:hypothetical protein Bca52824_016716 [Brassica carinata]|uniref:Reverse transcriptase zinc-binding domain-containing protein n=1 Tax=Brassica carinata TaxID=52824 RepID=A0A8X7W7K5_BRACI|nr:hypothetical protein Bca52824_016716 [Brassica carinata]
MFQDGASTRFWSDNWSPFGNMRDFLNITTPSVLGICQNATLADLYYDGGWHLPPPRSDTQLALHTFLTTLNLSQAQDCFEWTQPGRSSLTFKTGQTYDLIKIHSLPVSWSKIVWFARGIPKHSFLTWLVTLNRCPTRDRIISWGLSTTPHCLLCNAADETRDHIFFECPFSFAVWDSLARKANCLPSLSWSQTLNYLEHRTCSKPERCLGLLAWQASIYFIWTERNNRLHRQHFRSSTSIAASAYSLVKNKISSFRDQNPVFCSSLLQIWIAP